jgi:imidazolonepropionase
MIRVREVIAQGTGAIEIKSGYGLSTEGELKMLRVARRIQALDLLPVRVTFLGAHALPQDYKNNKAGYIDFIIGDMLPKIAEGKLADYIDIFCENGYFTAEETRKVLNAGKEFGLTGKVHAEQMSHSGGIQAGVACGAISVDHLEYCSDEDIEALKQSATMPTVLPGAAFFVSLPLPPARKMIDAGLPVAFASDFNPGTSPSGNMNFMMSLGCVQYKLTPEEVINACTINSAYAMGVSSEVGSITPGKKANFFITQEISSYYFIPYAFGSNLVDRVFLNGQEQARP